MSQKADQTTFIPRKNSDVEFASAMFKPGIDTSESYHYGVMVELDTFFNGGAANKYYGVMVDGDQNTASTGDSNSAFIRVSGNNYAANDANYILRGLNVGINNRSGGTMGQMENSMGVQNKSGGTIPALCSLRVRTENYGTCATEFGGIDINLSNEGTVATTEYGLRVRNTNNSIADAVGAALLITDTGANTGFDYILDASGASVVAAVLNLKDDGTAVDAGGGTVGSATSGGFIRVKIGSTYFKIQLYDDS